MVDKCCLRLWLYLGWYSRKNFTVGHILCGAMYPKFKIKWAKRHLRRYFWWIPLRTATNYPLDYSQASWFTDPLGNVGQLRYQRQKRSKRIETLPVSGTAEPCLSLPTFLIGSIVKKHRKNPSKASEKSQAIIWVSELCYVLVTIIPLGTSIENWKHTNQCLLRSCDDWSSCSCVRSLTKGGENMVKNHDYFKM